MTLIEPNALRLAVRDGTPVPPPSLSYFDHWQATEDALFVLAVHDGVFTFEGINPACERVMGQSNEDLAGKTPEEMLPPANAAVVTARYRQCVSEGKALSYLETLDFPAGVSDWRTHLEPVRNETGRITRILGRARRLENPDATPEDLTEGEFRKALDIFPLGIALLDAQGVILYVNATWRNFGRQHGSGDGTEKIGEAYVDVCGSPTSVGLPDGAAVADKLRQLIAGEDQGQFGHAYTWQKRHFVLRAARLTLNGRVRVTMSHQDVTDVVNARELAARSLEQILQAQEEERARIALEVHNSTAQHLVAIGLGLAKLRDSNAEPQVLDDLRHSLSEAHREIRALAYLLYPPKLSSEGLAATLGSFSHGFGRRTGLKITFAAVGPVNDLSHDIQRTVFRIVQEALANVHRHAEAEHVAVKVALQARGLRVTVIDDGRSGFGGADRVVGVGIRGMQARFAQFGGELTVTHGAAGTVVDGFLPRAKLGPSDPFTL